MRCVIGEWRLVQPAGLHHAIVGEVLDDEVDETDLIDCESRVAQELRKCFDGGLAIQADQ